MTFLRLLFIIIFLLFASVYFKGNFKSLKDLNMSNNRISQVPEWLSELPCVSLDVSRNVTLALPSSLQGLSNIETLNLSLCNISALPESFGNVFFSTRFGSPQFGFNQIVLLLADFSVSQKPSMARFEPEQTWKPSL